MKIKRNSGFSLIELLFVMAILAIVTAIAVPNMNRYIQNYHLESAARDLASDFAALKQRAATENIHYRISLSNLGTANSSYTLQRETNQDSGIYSNTSTKTPASYSSDIKISDKDGGTTYQPDEAPSIKFEPRGTTQAGTVVLTNSRGSNATITTSLMGRIRVVYVKK